MAQAADHVPRLPGLSEIDERVAAQQVHNGFEMANRPVAQTGGSDDPGGDSAAQRGR